MKCSLFSLVLMVARLLHSPNCVAVSCISNLDLLRCLPVEVESQYFLARRLEATNVMIRMPPHQWHHCRRRAATLLDVIGNALARTRNPIVKHAA